MKRVANAKRLRMNLRRLAKDLREDMFCMPSIRVLYLSEKQSDGLDVKRSCDMRSAKT